MACEAVRVERFSLMAIATKVSGDRVRLPANYHRPFLGFTQPLPLLGSDVVAVEIEFCRSGSRNCIRTRTLNFIVTHP